MDRNYAYISVNGTGSTLSVTEALRLEPTSEWNVGDKRNNKSCYEFSHWEYKSPEFEQETIDAAILKVVEFIEIKCLDFTKVPDGFQAVISCAGWHEVKSPGFHLSKDLIVRLRNIGLAVDFDLYCHASTNS